MEEITGIGEHHGDNMESLETCGFEAESHGSIGPPVCIGISDDNARGVMVNSQPLCHLPLMRSNTPVQLTPPPTTPVMRVYNSHCPSTISGSNLMQLAAEEASSQLQHNGNFSYTPSSSLVPAMIAPGHGQVDTTGIVSPSSTASLPQPSGVNSPMFVLNSRFPVCSIPAVNAGAAYPGAMYHGNRYSNVPFGTSVPAVSIPPGFGSRNFPLLQATFFSIQGPTNSNPYLPQDNVVSPVASSPCNSFYPNSYPLTVHAHPPSDHVCSSRPPFSFSALIAMAIQSSPKKMVTLPEIYEFITSKFPFYKQEDKKWKNSIRHNLSLNKCFKKAPRKDGLLGKGNYWIIDPACDHVLENGNFRSPARKRRGKHKSSHIGAEDVGDRDGGVQKVDSEESLMACGTGSTETKAILNPSMSAAEIVIPPIASSSSRSSSALERMYSNQGTQHNLTVADDHTRSQSHAMQHSSQVGRSGHISCSAGGPLDHLKFGVEKLLS